MDEARLSLEMARAAQAQRLLEDTMFQDAFNAVKAKYEADWIGSRLDDEKKRERCFLAMRALDDVIRQFETHIATGKLAKAQVKAKAKVN
jgi:hypothetical protein